jgi:hypothetical protein
MTPVGVVKACLCAFLLLCTYNFVFDSTHLLSSIVFKYENAYCSFGISKLA